MLATMSDAKFPLLMPRAVCQSTGTPPIARVTSQIQFARAGIFSPHWITLPKTRLTRAKAGTGYLRIRARYPVLIREPRDAIMIFSLPSPADADICSPTGLHDTGEDITS